MILTFFSFIGRLGAFTGSVIVAGLVGKILQDIHYLSDFLIYIEVLSGVTILAAFIPPYPNFLYDAFFGLAWIVAAGFMLLDTFIESDCYGFSQLTGHCGRFTAATTFTFLVAIAWIGSAGFGFLRLLAAILYSANKKGRRTFAGPFDPKKDEEEPPEYYPHLGGILAKNIVKYWPCYGLGGIALIAIVIPILIVYALPPFAQYLADRIEVPINVNVSFTNPTNDSVTFSVWSPIKIPGAVYPILYPMNVSFFLEDTWPNVIPFATVNLPKLKFKPHQHLELVNQTLRLGDIGEFARLVEGVAYNKTFTVAGAARGKAGIPGIKMNVNLHKVVEFQGFDNFTDFTINWVRLMRADSEGNNIEASVAVPNPAPARIDLGNATGQALIAGIPVGQATIDSVSLRPGNNSYVFKGRGDFKAVSDNINRILEYEFPYVRQGLVAASAKGTSIVYNGVHLEYWEKALQSIELTATREAKPIVMQALSGSLDQFILDNGLSGLLGPIVDSAFFNNTLSGGIDALLEIARAFPDDATLFGATFGPIGKVLLALLPLLGFS